MRTNIWSRFAFLLMVPTVVPAPRKMTLGSGQFVVERGAKISVAHADDRTAAETLADEI